MAVVAVVTLPKGVSVVLISISCLKISRAWARSSAEAVGKELCAEASEDRTSASMGKKRLSSRMEELYRLAACFLPAIALGEEINLSLTRRTISR